MIERRKLFSPSRVPLVLLNLTAGVLVFGLVLGVIYGSSGPNLNFWQDFATMFGMVCTSAAAVLAQVAAWLERNPGAKLAAGAGSMALVVLAAALTALAMILSGSPEVVAGLFFFMVPALLVFSIPTVMGGGRLVERWREATQADREDALAALIAKQGGTVTDAEVMAALGINRDEAIRLVGALVEKGRVAGERLAAYERFYTREARRKQELLILGQIEAEGSVFIEDIALRFDLPLPLVKEMIYALVERGRFAGYINWDEGKLYSAAAGNIEGMCPNCGGKLTVAGRNIIQCEFCSAEVFIT
jgi:hypothetical protein